MFGFLDMMGTYEQRKVDLYKDEVLKIMVSTAKVTDGRQPYETAVCHPEYNSGNHIIVQDYNTKAEAQTGHNNWVTLMTSDKLPDKLVDIANSEIAQLIGKETFKRVKK